MSELENLKYEFGSYERKKDRRGAERKNQEELGKGKEDKVSWEDMVGGSLIESPMGEWRRVHSTASTSNGDFVQIGKWNLSLGGGLPTQGTGLGKRGMH